MYAKPHPTYLDRSIHLSVQPTDSAPLRIAIYVYRPLESTRRQ